MRSFLGWCSVAALFSARGALAVEYECTVERKVDPERVYTDEQLRQGHFSVRIVEKDTTATLSRCSFTPSEQRITCDRYDVDRIVVDEVQKFRDDKVVPGEYVKIKKYYRFRGQLDVQLFSDLSFVENNGRGGIAYGKCRVVSP